MPEYKPGMILLTACLEHRSEKPFIHVMKTFILHKLKEMTVPESR